MRPLFARGHLGLGRLYARTGKRVQAQEHTKIAPAIYRELRMPYWFEQAQRAIKELAWWPRASVSEQREGDQADDTSSGDKDRLRDLEPPEHAETDERHEGGRQVIDCAPG
jgi:hypothetical protein